MADYLVTQIDPKFLAHLDCLADVNEAAADASCLSGQRKWYNPPADGWSGDPQDIEGLNKAFDRDNLNTLYKQVVTDRHQRGRQGDAMFLKLQIDYLSALERAYRTRQASSVRCKIHAARRCRGHSSDGGLYDTGGGQIVIWLQRLLSAAHTDPSP
jgi:hypothetical protein